MTNIKSPIILENSIDETGQLVLKVFARHKSKLGRDVYAMVWQYYRDRKKVPVKSIIRKYQKEDLRIIYSGKKIGAAAVQTDSEKNEEINEHKEQEIN